MRVLEPRPVRAQWQGWDWWVGRVCLRGTVQREERGGGRAGAAECLCVQGVSKDWGCIAWHVHRRDCRGPRHLQLLYGQPAKPSFLSPEGPWTSLSNLHISVQDRAWWRRKQGPGSVGALLEALFGGCHTR